MSLQHAAKYLANQGRGKDTMLVHMTPREVGSLQALAMAQGGSLSINPDTGLPEAGFLDSMLPMLLGVGITAATGGAAAPWMLGLGVGGIQALRTGDIGKGITAGLGAYGGAGLGAGLLGAGASSTAAEMAGGLQGASAGELAAAQQGVAQNVAQASTLDRLATMGNGIGALGSEAGRAGFMSGVGGGAGLAKAGLAAASPFMMDEVESDMPQAKGSGPNPYRYRFERGEANPFPELSQTGIERSYFPNARYVPYAGGGAVEAMSDANAVGANTGFPMADIQRGAYATPYQQPISQNVVTGASDTRVDPYTGTERLAEGGMAKQNPLLDSPYPRDYLGNQSAGAPATAAPTDSGSPTGSIFGDIAFGMQGLQGMMGLTGLLGDIAANSVATNSPVSATSVNAVNGMDAQSDAATAANMSNAPTVATESAIADAVAAAIGDAATAVSADGVSSAAGVSAGDGGASGGGGGGAGGDGSAGGDGGAGVSGGEGEANGGLLRRKYAMGGLSDLGSYSDGGRLLRGPGDGVSDSIPAVIGQRQPARLADGEFVIPARIVSELGNGSTEAGARKLYAMMDRVQKARSKTVGKGKIAKNTRADKHLPA